MRTFQQCLWDKTHASHATPTGNHMTQQPIPTRYHMMGGGGGGGGGGWNTDSHDGYAEGAIQLRHCVAVCTVVHMGAEEVGPCV